MTDYRVEIQRAFTSLRDAKDTYQTNTEHLLLSIAYSQIAISKELEKLNKNLGNLNEIIETKR